MKKISIIQLILWTICVVSTSHAQTPPPPPCDDYRIIDIDVRHKEHAQLSIPLSLLQEVEEPKEQPPVFRRLHWLHGLGGNSNALVKVAQACMDPSLNISSFPARRVYSTVYDYSNITMSGLSFVAFQVGDKIKQTAQHDANSSISPNRGILFGHSQGAVLGRAILHWDLVQDTHYAATHGGRGYGGFVSIAGSLQGANILNNRDLIHLMANDACRKLAKGFTEGTREGSFMNTLLRIFSKTNLGDITQGVCDIFSEDVLPLFFSKYYDQITDDYTVGAFYINTLNADTNYETYRNFPKIALYGVEPRENLLWRTANWLINDPNSVPPFEANNDFDFLNKTIVPMYNTYKSKYEHHKAKADAIKVGWWWWMFDPIGAGIAQGVKSDHIKKSQAWQQGKEWFEHANSSWHAIIGAPLQIHRTSSDGKTHITITAEENDGIVVKSSAENLPYATHPPVKVCPVGNGYAGSSHMQIRNDAGIKEALMNLFEGNYGLFFKTKER
jgi:hypothetical protein